MKLIEILNFKSMKKEILGILGVLCLFLSQNLKAQTYYAIAYTSERTDGDGGTEHRRILSRVFPVKFCKDETVSLRDASNVTSEAKLAIEDKFVEEYNYALGRKNYWIGNKRYVQVHMYETSNEATSQMKKIIADYKTRSSDKPDIGMIDIRLDCIK